MTASVTKVAKQREACRMCKAMLRQQRGKIQGRFCPALFLFVLDAAKVAKQTLAEEQPWPPSGSRGPRFATRRLRSARATGGNYTNRWDTAPIRMPSGRQSEHVPRCRCASASSEESIPQLDSIEAEPIFFSGATVTPASGGGVTYASASISTVDTKLIFVSHIEYGTPWLLVKQSSC